MNEEWATYLPSLTSCLLATKGAVLEVGMGNFSTPMLRNFCRAADRQLVHVEDNFEWSGKFDTLSVSYDILSELAKMPWSVIFLDHSPGSRRAQDALLFKDTAEFIVVHDFESEDVWSGFTDIIGPNWNYVQIDKRFKPWTLTLGRKEL